jgi:hypothetical protein
VWHSPARAPGCVDGRGTLVPKAVCRWKPSRRGRIHGMCQERNKGAATRRQFRRSRGQALLGSPLNRRTTVRHLPIVQRRNFCSSRVAEGLVPGTQFFTRTSPSSLTVPPGDLELSWVLPASAMQFPRTPRRPPPARGRHPRAPPSARRPVRRDARSRRRPGRPRRDAHRLRHVSHLPGGRAVPARKPAPGQSSPEPRRAGQGKARSRRRRFPADRPAGGPAGRTAGGPRRDAAVAINSGRSDAEVHDAWQAAERGTPSSSSWPPSSWPGPKPWNGSRPWASRCSWWTRHTASPPGATTSGPAICAWARSAGSWATRP